MSEVIAGCCNAELIERYKNGETILEETIIAENMGLVRASAYRLLRYAGSGTDYEDLCQIGSIGLLKALRRFDTGRGVVFSTYAVPMIIGEMRKFLRDDGPVKVGRKLREQYLKIRKADESLTARFLRSPTLSELEAETGMSREDIVLAYDAVSAPESLDSTIDADGNISLSDTVSDGGAMPDIDRMALKEGLKMLCGDERKLISLRYFLSKTQQETAEILGMTQVQVSRREKKIIEKLRTAM